LRAGLERDTLRKKEQEERMKKNQDELEEQHRLRAIYEQQEGGGKGLEGEEKME